MTLEAPRREQLLAIKLVGLTRSVLESSGRVIDADVLELARVQSRGVLTALAVGDTAFVFVEQGTPGTVASAAIWSIRGGCDQLMLLVDKEGERAARFASYLQSARLRIQVFNVEGGQARLAEAELVGLASAAPEVPEEFAALFDSLGLETVVEHGVVRAEVLGLEIARLVPWPGDSVGSGELHLDVGVGRFDRDAVAAVNPDASPADLLSATAELVRRHRYRGAPVHPLQILCRERWLRCSVISDPESVGASHLRPVAMTMEVDGLRDSHPAAAVGVDLVGNPLLVVCSTGVDLALVPMAAELRSLEYPSARLTLAVPEVDRAKVTMELAEMLNPAADVAAVPAQWAT